MKPQHHPHEELLLRYAAGELSEPVALIVASHLAFCLECRIGVMQAEALGGALLESLPAETLSGSDIERQLEQTLGRAAGSPALVEQNISMARASHADSMIPQPLRGYVGDIDAVRWSSLGSGIQHHIVTKDRHGAIARLLKVAPGHSIFEHGHAGTELTLVLRGTYQAAGMRFTCGDVECADETTDHRPIAGGETACICLVVTDAPLRFHNLLGRLMQPFLGI